MPPSTVTVHRTQVDPRVPLDPAMPGLAWLDEGERERLAAFTSEPARARYAAGHVLLRSVLAAALGVDPARPRYDRSCEHCGHPTHGRPRLAGPDPALDFSLSHSGAAVVVAVGPGPLGVDVEDLTRRPVTTGVVERMTTPDERGLLPAAGVPGRHRAVLELWTRKEAVGKALGLGVTLPFASFAAPVGRAINAGPEGGPTLVVWPVEVPGAVASVAVLPGVTVTLARLRP